MNRYFWNIRVRYWLRDRFNPRSLWWSDRRERIALWIAPWLD